MRRQNSMLSTGFSATHMPFRYLGVPITNRKLNVQHYLDLIDKITCRIKQWSVKLLIYAGRAQLLKSVSFAITDYWMQCFPLPKHALK